jgi:hypothetical protein
MQGIFRTPENREAPTSLKGRLESRYRAEVQAPHSIAWFIRVVIISVSIDAGGAANGAISTPRVLNKDSVQACDPLLTVND